jgi:hypothetical protein
VGDKHRSNDEPAIESQHDADLGTGLLHVKESSGVRRKRAKEAGERGLDIQRGHLERANHTHPHLLLIPSSLD